MKKTAITLILAMLVVMVAPTMFADGAATFKAKCAACHGADGAKNAKANLASAEVQGKSDADLITFVGTNAKHNFKAKGLSDDDIKAVVAFLRTLKK